MPHHSYIVSHNTLSGQGNANSDAYHYFGINYDKKRKGWIYREWAPAANALYLTGDFNNWDETSYPLQMNEFGIWELFIEEETHKDTFVHGSKIKVIVDSLFPL